METKDNKQLKDNELEDVNGGIIYVAHVLEEVPFERLNNPAVMTDAGLKPGEMEDMNILEGPGGCGYNK